ncbi:MAG: rhombotarget lipoprotein [Wenzhouxiangella sp.]
MKRTNVARLMTLGLMLLMLAGCAGFLGLDTRTGASSSVVDYLYPDGSLPDLEQERLPVIELPARVGLAFVPSTRQAAGLGPADRDALLQEARSAFARQGYIDRIEIIPDSYLRPGGGFTNLEQVARLYGVDIVALVSFDQIIQTTETTRSLLYWTLVGAYTIEGSRNEVITFVDTAVIHLPSHTLLFRAAGQDRQENRSTAIHAGRVQNRLAHDGFRQAMGEMTGNLDQALVDFNHRVRSEGQVRLVHRRSGRSWHEAEGGQGRTVWLEALFLLALLATATQLKRQRP